VPGVEVVDGELDGVEVARAVVGRRAAVVDDDRVRGVDERRDLDGARVLVEGQAREVEGAVEGRDEGRAHDDAPGRRPRDAVHALLGPHDLLHRVGQAHVGQPHGHLAGRRHGHGLDHGIEAAAVGRAVEGQARVVPPDLHLAPELHELERRGDLLNRIDPDLHADPVGRGGLAARRRRERRPHERVVAAALADEHVDELPVGLGAGAGAGGVARLVEDPRDARVGRGEEEDEDAHHSRAPAPPPFERMPNPARGKKSTPVLVFDAGGGAASGPELVELGHGPVPGVALTQRRFTWRTAGGPGFWCPEGGY
jgi:hypothetical protein